MNQSSEAAETSKSALFNITEELVKQKVREIMNCVEMCRCEQCFLNACAIALNELSPYYVTTDKGSLLSTLHTVNLEYQTELTVIVTKAVMKVKDNPRH